MSAYADQAKKNVNEAVETTEGAVRRGLDENEAVAAMGTGLLALILIELASLRDDLASLHEPVRIVDEKAVSE